MRVRDQQKRQTRARLLEVSFELFSKNGITTTRTIDVARAAGVSHGTIFAHFPTRDDLVAAVIIKYTKRIVRRIHELVERGAGVRDVLAAHLEGLSEHEAFYSRLVTEGPVLSPYARTTLIGLQSATSYHLSQAAKAEIKEHRLKNIPLHLLFNTWLGLVHHYLVNRDLFAPGKSVLSSCGEELLIHYMELLAP